MTRLLSFIRRMINFPMRDGVGHQCSALTARRLLVLSVLTLVAIVNFGSPVSRKIYAGPPDGAVAAKRELAELELQFELFLRKPAQRGSEVQAQEMLTRLKQLEGDVLGERLKQSSREIVHAANRALGAQDHAAGLLLYEQYVDLLMRLHGERHPCVSEARKVLDEIRGESEWTQDQREQLLTTYEPAQGCEPRGGQNQLLKNVETLRGVRQRMLAFVTAEHSLFTMLYSMEFANLLGLGQYQEALRLTRRELEIHEPLSVPGEAHLSIVRLNEAWVLEKLSLYSEALEILRKLEAGFPSDEPPVAQEEFWNTRASIMSRMGAHQEARNAIERYLRLLNQRYPWDQRKLVIALSNQGTILEAGGDPAAAIPVLVKTREAALKVGDRQTAYRAQLSLALAYVALYRFEDAVREAENSLGERETMFPEHHPDVLNCRKELARIYHRSGDHESALKLIERSLKTIQTATQVPPGLVSEANQIRAILLRGLGRHAEARQALLEAERLAPPGGGTSAIPRLTRLSWDVEQGVAGAQEELERLAIELGAKLRPREAVLVHETLADARTHASDLPGAIQALDASRRALRVHRQINLPGLSQSDQLAQVQSLRPLGSHHRLFEFAGKIEEPTLTEMTVEWVLNDKGFVHEVMADFQRFQRSLSNVRDRRMSEELQVTQGALAKALAAGESLDQPAVARLAQQADQLSLQLGVAARTGGLSRPWIGVADVRSRIPEDAVLIEVLRTESAEAGKTQAAYHAWVIPPTGKGAAQLVSLGAADEIEAGITAFRGNMLRMQQSAEISAVNRPLRDELVAESAEVTAKLAQLILGRGSAEPDRLLPLIQDFRHWIIAPDAALWLFPWETMPTEHASELVVQRHVVSYVNCGRQLMSPALSPKSGDTLALFDPAFGEGQFRPAFLNLTAPWAQLPATADQRVGAEAFFRKTGGRPHSLTGENATEDAFSQTCRSPAELLVATHGYSALADQPRKAANRVAKLEQPLRFCGIVLAGANRPPSEMSDNYLTGEEISNLQLDGCHAFCVVCVGGLGVSQDAQGVASINQAFQLAGTRTLVTTLWEIQQQAGTIPLMNTYWSERASGAIPEVALRTAKLAVLQEERTTHPYFWAAFTLSGSSRDIQPLVTASAAKTDSSELRIKADLLNRHARYKEALDLYDELLRQHNDAELLAGRGLALLGLSRKDEAKQSLEQARAADPRHELTRCGWAMFLALSSDVSQARQEAESILSDNQKSPRGLTVRALSNVLSITKDHDLSARLTILKSVEQDSRQACAGDPELLEAQLQHASCSMGIAGLLEEIGRQQAMSEASKSEIRAWREKAVASLDQIEQRNDTVPFLYLLRANAKLQLLGKDSPEAIADCCEACRRDSADPPFVKLLVQSIYLPKTQQQPELMARIARALGTISSGQAPQIEQARRDVSKLMENGLRQLQQTLDDLPDQEGQQAKELSGLLTRARRNYSVGNQIMERILETVRNNGSR